MPNVSAEPLQLQKQRFITGEVLSEAGRSQRKGFSFNRPSVLVHVAPYEHKSEGVLHSTDRVCLSMLRPMNTQSCGKETPCGKSPSHTRVGSQALLDRLYGFPRD